jgi:hypothetical protein
MSKSLILDWQKNSLMLARAHGRVPRAVVESVSIKPYGSGDASLQTANEALRTAAQELSAKGETIVLVARDLVELRTVQIPKMDPDDLPDVIRFQAQRLLDGGLRYASNGSWRGVADRFGRCNFSSSIE